LVAARRRNGRIVCIHSLRAIIKDNSIVKGIREFNNARSRDPAGGVQQAEGDALLLILSRQLSGIRAGFPDTCACQVLKVEPNESGGDLVDVREKETEKDKERGRHGKDRFFVGVYVVFLSFFF
jgi:hypothetical protein